jgi:hypothetical protein
MIRRSGIRPEMLGMNENLPRARTFLRAILVACIIFAGVAFIARAADVSTPINVTLCDLVRRPLDFENKHIRIQGRARFIFEVRALVDDNCPADNQISGMIWLDFDESFYKILKYSRGWSWMDYARAVNAGELKGEGPSVAWQTASAVAPLEPDKISAFFQALKKRRGRKVDKDVLVTIVGRFDFAGGGLLVYTQDKNFTFATGFGHINGYSRRIVIESIELVKKKK